MEMDDFNQEEISKLRDSYGKRPTADRSVQFLRDTHMLLVGEMLKKSGDDRDPLWLLTTMLDGLHERLYRIEQKMDN